MESIIIFSTTDANNYYDGDSTSAFSHRKWN